MLERKVIKIDLYHLLFYNNTYHQLIKAYLLHFLISLTFILLFLRNLYIFIYLHHILLKFFYPKLSISFQAIFILYSQILGFFSPLLSSSILS